jgi:CBS domain-containing protein
MKAMDVMVRDVVTVKPDDGVAAAIKLLAEHDVSALPVVDEHENVVGVISEADLIHRNEIGTEKQRPWWLEAVTPASTLAEEFAKSHGRHVEKVMSTEVISASEDTPLGEIRDAARTPPHQTGADPAWRQARRHRQPGEPHSGPSLSQAQTAAGDGGTDADRKIRLELLDRLDDQSWTDFGQRNVIVSDGIVHLWGLVGSENEHKALLALAEGVPGVASVSDEMIPAY